MGALVLSASAVIAVGVLAARDTGPATPLPAQPAAQAYELAGTDPVSGKPVSLAEHRGKPVVVVIWASWCHGCNAEGPEFARFIDAHPEIGFLGINFQDQPADAAGFLDHYGWKLSSIGDPEGVVAYSLGLQGTPTTIFLDEQHREVTRIIGASDVAGFEAALAKVTA